MLKRVRLTNLLSQEIEDEIVSGHVPEPLSQERIDKALKYAKEYLSEKKRNGSYSQK